MTKENETVFDSQNTIGSLADRYRIVSRLGDGSMGVVYEAEHAHMKKRVALKVMREELLENKEAVARFQREGQAAAGIDHPNVCAATDFGQLEDGRYFLVLEYLDGPTLKDVLKSTELSAERAVNITSQMVSALAKAHKAGIVHRDLKPDNILLIDREGEADFVKITDFGVALVEDSSAPKLTRAGTTMGTPIYMSPEQAKAIPADARSDLYTVGVMLFEMLAGQVPFYSKSLAVILSMHAQEKPPTLYEVAPDREIPASLAEIVAKLLEKDPEDRFQTAEELLEALTTADLSVTALPSLGESLSAGSEADDVGGLVSDIVSEANEDRDEDAIGTVTDVPDEAVKPAAGVIELGADSVFDKTMIDNFPAPSTERAPRTFNDYVRDASPTLKIGVVFGVCMLIAVVALGSLYMAADVLDTDDGDEMAFSVTETVPQGLEEERNDYLGSSGLAEALKAASTPEERVAALTSAGDGGANAHHSYVLGLARAASGNPSDAVGDFAKAVELDPRYAGEPDVVAMTANAFAAAKKDAEAAEAQGLLTTLADTAARSDVGDRLAATGLEGKHAARKRARNLLQSTGLWEELPEWQRAGIELRLAGKNCNTLKKHIKRLGELGDPGALPVLERTEKLPRKGCGFLKRGDCYECMRGDLKKAIKALESSPQ